jgi:hypothetical protein
MFHEFIKSVLRRLEHGREVIAHVAEVVRRTVAFQQIDLLRDQRRTHFFSYQLVCRMGTPTRLTSMLASS